MSLRNRLRPLKGGADRAVEPLWQLAFRSVGTVIHRDIDQWETRSDQRVLVVASHPKDEAIGCAGTILRHVRGRDRVRIAIATDGSRSTDKRDAERNSAIRMQEANEAARLMGIEGLDWLGLAEGAWDTEALQGKLCRLLAVFRPHIIYAPSRIDFHLEHFKVSHALALTLDNTAAPACLIRIYQLQVPLTRALANLATDTAELQNECVSILCAYASQSASVECTYRQRRYAGLLYGTANPLELFWEMTSAQYAALHRAPPAEWSNRFRGLRHAAFSDPLAFLAGLGERRRLKTQLRSAQ